MDAQEIAQLVVEALREERKSRGIDPEVHAYHHTMLEKLIATNELAEARLAQIVARNERIKEKIFGSAILAGCIAALGLLGAGALKWFRDNL